MCDKLLTFRNFKVFDVGSVSENFSNIFRGYFFIKSDFMPHSRSFFTFYPKKDIFKIIMQKHQQEWRDLLKGLKNILKIPDLPQKLFQ